MPLQHADDEILRAMRRERSGAALHKILDRIRKRVPGIRCAAPLSWDFPGDRRGIRASRRFHQRTGIRSRRRFYLLARREYCRFDLPNQVPERVKRARRAHLMELQSDISLKRIAK